MSPHTITNISSAARYRKKHPEYGFDQAHRQFTLQHLRHTRIIGEVRKDRSHATARPIPASLHDPKLEPTSSFQHDTFFNYLNTPQTSMPRPKRDIHAVAEETVTPPDALPGSHNIARVKQAAGNNLYQLQLPSGEILLAELPARFRSTIWIKRGSFVLVDSSALAGRDNKLGGEIVNVVRDEKAWRKTSYWPVEFAKKSSAYEDESEDEGPGMPPSDSGDEVS